MQEGRRLRTECDPPATHKIACPDCGPVAVAVDVYDSGKPVSGECPECGDGACAAGDVAQ